MVRVMDRTKVARGIAVAVGATFLLSGLWAFLAPQSWFDNIGNYPPYNKHFVHDLGAFQIGLGGMALLSLLWKAPLLAALAANAVAAIFHLASHLIDRDLGGRSTDPLLLGIFALLILWGAFSAAEPAPKRPVITKDPAPPLAPQDQDATRAPQ
jgi:hypothetical protein